jgi:hypothetical protein
MPDAHGHFVGRLRVTYVTAKPVQATLTLSVSTKHSTAKKAIEITILPAIHGKK